MRATFAKTVAVSLAALTLIMGLSAGPAAAKPWPKPFGGFGGIGLVGAIGLGLVGAVVAHEREHECVRYRPVFDDYGNFIGRRPVNICD
jgi:hypothetical protein